MVLWALPNDGGEPVQLGSLSVLPDGSFLASAGLERLMAGQYTVQANGFAAEGVACAFTWRPGSSRSVAFWRQVP